MSRQVIVTYRLKQDRVAEHEGLIRAVFAELAEKSPPGLRYSAFRKTDGVTYFHVAIVPAEKNPLDTVAAFKAFGEKIKERCEEPPVVTDVATIGSFAF